MDSEGSGGEDRQNGACGAGGPGNPGGANVAGAEDATGGGAPQAQGPSVGNESGANASSGEGASESTILEFSMMVPFLYYVEVVIARISLGPVAAPYGVAVYEEIRVIGSDLAVRLIANDSNQLQIAIASLVNQLYVVVWIMQRFRILFSTKPRPGNGG
ncbi:PREDICTED: cancer/testis antigen 1-like [Chrysochloris asiatica]|uniref:Cancer/testis antigen 1-like n=1 Tax=Chrysochloris asiatica TaxID=185453 RepID=A0A9B0X3G3_CHRAS|nr:PREDICTED: cancer/testis antigen 1-like [Chrysochloris asiatica]